MAIDRKAVVSRHNVHLQDVDSLTPLSVGNGEFAFTVDVTGLQSLPALYDTGMPLGTQAQWGWHTAPPREVYDLAQTESPYAGPAGQAPYPDKLTNDGVQSEAAAWLRGNAHRLHLGRIGLVTRAGTSDDFAPIAVRDLSDFDQTLDLWSGVIASEFRLGGAPVRVTTICHHTYDTIGIRLHSPLLASGCLAVRIAFCYSTSGEEAWADADRHTTVAAIDGREATFARTLDNDKYHVAVSLPPNSHVAEACAPHTWDFTCSGSDELDLSFTFSPTSTPSASRQFDEVMASSTACWQQFWESGAAVDLGKCSDPRAAELERRIVLSQYLTRIQCCGSLPPQESGLVMNSWHGKFHLEMHWWHAAHFAMWGRPELLAKSLPWYREILPMARRTAKRQGFAGARWPKMTDPSGRESPSTIGPFLVWQQPHPIYYAELLYRSNPTEAVLREHAEMVHETAEFMASYPTLDSDGRYVLGPPIIPAQESYDVADGTINPTFELAYWYWGLSMAQVWRERLGLPRDERWDAVRDRLAKPTIRDGVYTAIETAPYTKYVDHPSMLMALGFVPPTPLIDANVMRRTLESVLEKWDWGSAWGWDFPVLAMTATRLDLASTAIDALLMDVPKNTYFRNGHNFQVTTSLPLYLPGNGGLLAAIAMMAGGLDDVAPKATLEALPGWNATVEGFPGAM
ncbi:MAG TPA: hypothetical protein VGK19_09715 [Capsulimonadaceae bacterium]|jgi:hypothetical protein